MIDRITQGIKELEIEEIQTLVQRALDSGHTADKILDAIRKGADEVGRFFEEGTYFISDLVMAGQIMKTALEILQPHLKAGGESQGKIVLGTIEGDIHDIGKQIVKTFMASAGFEVHDLGVDVPAKKFAEAAKDINADIVAVSVLFSVAALNLESVVEEIRTAGLREKVKVIAGGAAARQEYINRFGVDAAVNDAITGMDKIRSWMAEKR
ncbi:MAG: hypothetical protein GTN80_07850 [Nitrososphaeria archaeon]|nr:hypothetical protein [Nitrososphaeria archaeon]NIQ33536.1 hypothetical protein [Nitrososphaeria archaeon]